MLGLLNAFAAGFDQRWRAMSFLKQTLIVVGLLVAGAGVGSLTGSSDGVAWGVGMVVAFMAAIAGFVWWREPSKTILGLFFFTPLTLLAGQRQAEIIAPLAPVPAITTTPLLLWMVIVGIVVHRVKVPRQWLRAVIVVQTAGIAGWLLGLVIGSAGVIAGYVISAVLLYVLTFGWAPLRQRRLTRSLMKTVTSDSEDVVFSLPLPASTVAGQLGDGWTVVEDVVLPDTDGKVEFPIVLVGPTGVFPVVKRKHSGVVREERSGVAIGGQPAVDVLAPVAAAAASLAAVIKVPTDAVRVLYVPAGASIYKGRADVSLFDGTRKVFDVAVVREKSIADEVTGDLASEPVMGEKARDRAIVKLQGLTRGAIPA